jgi:hypothetical protein
MASYTTVTGLYRHVHSSDVQQGGSLSSTETYIDNLIISTYIAYEALIEVMIYG